MERTNARNRLRHIQRPDMAKDEENKARADREHGNIERPLQHSEAQRSFQAELQMTPPIADTRYGG